MATDRTTDPAGHGTLGRLTTAVYWFVVVDLLVVAASLPGVVLLLLLVPDSTNIPLAALAAVPVGPAVSAALFAWRDFDRDRDQSPALHFWKGYRLNALDVLRLWVPALAVLTVLGVNLANAGAAGLVGVTRWITLGMALVVLLWVVHALVLTSLFSFRARDVARLAGYYVGARPRVTLGALSLLVLTTGLVVVVSDYVVLFLASLLTFLLLRNARAMVDDVQARFVA